jgi:hypothetical protein
MHGASSLPSPLAAGARGDIGVSADTARRLRFERQAPMKRLLQLIRPLLRRKNAISAAGKHRSFSAAGATGKIFTGTLNRKFASVVAEDGPHHRWDVANEAFTHRGRDWSAVTCSAPDAGARFSHLDGTSGINAKSIGTYHLIRDVKAPGPTG